MYKQNFVKKSLLRFLIINKIYRVVKKSMFYLVNKNVTEGDYY